MITSYFAVTGGSFLGLGPIVTGIVAVTAAGILLYAMTSFSRMLLFGALFGVLVWAANWVRGSFIISVGFGDTEVLKASGVDIGWLAAGVGFVLGIALLNVIPYAGKRWVPFP